MTVTQAPSIQGMLDSYLLARREFDGNRETAEGALWRASNIGMCLRRQWMEAMKIPHTNEPDARSLRRFLIGDVTAEALLKAFWHLGVLRHPEVPWGEELAMYDPELRVGGHVDAIIGGKIEAPGEDVKEETRKFLVYVRTKLTEAYGPELPMTGVEFKTTNSRSWWHAAKQNRPVAGEHQILQAATYDILAQSTQKVQVDRWVIACVSKDDCMIDEAGVTLGHKQKVLKRLEILNSAYDNGVVPDCECGEMWGGKAVDWCAYKTAPGKCCAA